VLIELLEEGNWDVRSSIVHLLAALAKQSERDPYIILLSLTQCEGEFHETLRLAIPVLITLLSWSRDLELLASVIFLLRKLAEHGEW
jgi:hypothetical protein